MTPCGMMVVGGGGGEGEVKVWNCDNGKSSHFSLLPAHIIPYTYNMLVHSHA